MNKIIFFSNNKDKVKEIKKLFNETQINILSLKDFGFDVEPKEIGKTFIENAKIKSEFGFKSFKKPCFADDSGICIQALKNKPGVLSKRFINNFKSKQECFKFIINEVNKTQNKDAYFKTSICLTLSKEHHIIFEGKINGSISRKPVGIKGFGYDPIFIPEGHNKTFGEMTQKEKNSVSHRSIAVNKLLNFLSN